MKILADLIASAQTGDESSMLEIIHVFQPSIRKYARLMNGGEDSSSDLTLHLIELVHSIQLEKLNTPNNFAIIKYISKSLYHQYISLSRKACAIRDKETQCEDGCESIGVETAPVWFPGQIEVNDLLERTLTPKEHLYIQLIVLHGYSATEIAKNWEPLSKLLINAKKGHWKNCEHTCSSISTGMSADGKTGHNIA